MCTQIGQEPVTVGIAAGDPAITEHQRVDRTRTMGALIHSVANLKRAELMRCGDIAPGKTGCNQAAYCRGKLVRLHAQRDIGSVDCMALEPEAMQPWGT